MGPEPVCTCCCSTPAAISYRGIFRRSFSRKHTPSGPLTTLRGLRSLARSPGFCTRNILHGPKPGSHRAQTTGCAPSQAQATDAPERLHADTFREAVDCLAERVLSTCNLNDPSSKWLVGISGVPGSGKSTLSKAVAARLNDLQKDQQSEPWAVAVGMDGFHYSRAQLDEMPDPEEAHAKRGAHWTFDGPAFVKAMKDLKASGASKLPSFDHNVKDPVQDDIVVYEHHRVVIMEGNYLHLDMEPWVQLTDLMDDSWYLDCDVDVAMERVFDRFLTMGLCAHEAEHRLNNNDSRNAELIAGFAHRAKLIVRCEVDAAVDQAITAEE